MDSNNSKYTILPKSCLDMWVESVGISKLPDDVGEVLAEDITYRLRETVNNALRITKHCKRTCLTVDDFNNALKESDTEPVYGHGGYDSLSFKAVTSKEGRICYVDEKEVNLREIALESVYPADPGETTVKASWLVLEGHPCVAGKVKEDHKALLSEPISSYLTNTTSALIGNSQQLRKIALKDLLVNKKLQVVLPHLVSFFSSQIKQNTGKDSFSQVSSYILLALNALVENSSILLSPYVFQLVKMMLFIIIDARIPVSKWPIKDKAAHVLAHLCRKHTSTLYNLSTQVMKSYQDGLNDDSRPLSYLYGAIVGIKILGPDAVYNVLCPVIKEKLKLVAEKKEKDTSYQDTMEIIAVQSAMVDTMGLLFSPRSNTLFENTRSDRNCATIYGELYEFFGEQFLSRCSVANHEHNYNGVAKHSMKNANQMPIARSNSVTTDLINKELEKLKNNKPVETTPKEEHIYESSIGDVVSTLKWKRMLKKNFLGQFSSWDVDNYVPRKKRKLMTVNESERKTFCGSHRSYHKKRKQTLVMELKNTSTYLPFV